jgi:hydroxymethylbilane synthase
LELPVGARVGTSSVRRKAQILRARPDIECVLLRGNVDTRLAKLEAGETDAILLAMAGLKRLGLADRVKSVLSTEVWLPSLAQGAVGLEIRKSDARTASLIGALNDEIAATELACERAFQAALDGSCRTPIAGLARIEAGRLRFRGEVIAPDGSDFAATDFQIQLGTDPRQDAARAGREAGTALLPRAARWLGL